MTFIIWLAFYLVVSANGECLYNAFYNKSLSPYDIPIAGARNLLYLTPLNQKISANCMSFCEQHIWCVASSQDTNTCKLYTDLNLLGFNGTFPSYCKLHGCELKAGSIVNFRENSFFVDYEQSLTNEYGNSIGDLVISPFVKTSQCNISNGFSGAQQAELQANTTSPLIYSNYYTANLMGDNAWTGKEKFTSHKSGDDQIFRMRVPKTSEPISNPSLFSSNFLYGLPLQGIRKDIISPYHKATKEEMTFAFQNAHAPLPSCFHQSEKPRHDQSLLQGKAFFHIRLKSTGQYLGCDVTEDDINSCYWTLEPNVIWNVAMFEVPIDADSGESENSVNIGRRAGFNKTLLAFDINSPRTEIGWLDRVYCDQHSDTGWHLRLIKNGKRFESDSSLHCGSRRWKVLRDDDFGTDWADSGLGAGSGLCAFSLIDSTLNPYDVGCISAVGEDSNNTSAQICTLAQKTVFSGVKHRCKRDGNHNANQIYFETTYGNNAVYEDEKGHYYRPAVISFNQLRLFCTETRCYWEQTNSSPTQFFIMRSQGLSDSTASIKDAYYTNAKQIVEVYELEASTRAWKKRGFLAYKDSQLYISSKQGSKETVGFVIHTAGLVYYEVGSETSNLVTKDGTVDATKVERNVLTRKIWLNRDDISENSTAIMKGNIQHVLSVSEDVTIYRDTDWVHNQTTCPRGSFLHQVNFFTDFSDMTFLCLQNTACYTSGEDQIEKKITYGEFTLCPDEMVVVGMNDTHITCDKLVKNYTISSIGSREPLSLIGGAINTREEVTLSTMPREELWIGSPLQALEFSDDKLFVWFQNKYMSKIQVLYSDTSFFNGARFTNISSPFEKVQCQSIAPDPNAFVNFIKCVDKKCQEGIKINCDATPKWRLSTNVTPIKVTSKTSGLYTCPPDYVITEIECTSTSHEAGVTTPCKTIALTCNSIYYDETFEPIPNGPKSHGDDPSGGSSSGGGSSSSSNTPLQNILIYLAISISICIAMIGLSLFFTCVAPVQKQRMQVNASTNFKMFISDPRSDQYTINRLQRRKQMELYQY